MTRRRPPRPTMPWWHKAACSVTFNLPLKDKVPRLTVQYRTDDCAELSILFAWYPLVFYRCCRFIRIQSRFWTRFHKTQLLPSLAAVLICWPLFDCQLRFVVSSRERPGWSMWQDMMPPVFSHLVVFLSSRIAIAWHHFHFLLALASRLFYFLCTTFVNPFYWWTSSWCGSIRQQIFLLLLGGWGNVSGTGFDRHRFIYYQSDWRSNEHLRGGWNGWAMVSRVVNFMGSK